MTTTKQKLYRQDTLAKDTLRRAGYDPSAVIKYCQLRIVEFTPVEALAYVMDISLTSAKAELDD